MVGNSYLLRRATCAVTWDADPQHLLTIPDEAIIRVLKQYRENGHEMVMVEWNHTKLSIFAVDLQERGVFVTNVAIASTST